MTHSISAWKRFRNNFPNAPIELKLFLIFSFLETIISLIIEIFAPQKLKESIIPITGWLTFMPYAVTLSHTYFQIAKSRNSNKFGFQSIRIKHPYFNIFFIAFFIVINIIEIWIGRGEDYGNPYLMISPWRPYWTILLPAVWILILFSPRIKKYYQTLELNPAA